MIEQSTEYKILQTKYSLVVNDNIKLKQALDESKNLLDMSRSTFQRQLEHMESEELAQQKKLGNEMMQLEEQLAQVRKENELLRIEYEQNVAANEQTGPINKEMRSLITTLQTNNKLLKSDINRTKKRLDESIQEGKRLKEQNAQLLNLKKEESVKKEPSNAAESTVNTATVKSEPSNDKETKEVKKEVKEEETTSSNSSNSSISSSSQIRELKEQNRKLNESNKELRGQLEIMKHKQSSPATPSTPSRSAELDDAKREIKRLKEQLGTYKSSNNKHTPSASSQSNSNNVTSPQLNPHSASSSNHHHHHHGEEHNNSHSSNDSTKKIKSLEETIKELQKNLNSKKQEEHALLNDMEITGQAFEDMQVIIFLVLEFTISKIISFEWNTIKKKF